MQQGLALQAPAHALEFSAEAQPLHAAQANVDNCSFALCVVQQIAHQVCSGMLQCTLSSICTAARTLQGPPLMLALHWAPQLQLSRHRKHPERVIQNETNQSVPAPCHRAAG